MGILLALLIAFIVLKILGLIALSWLWITPILVILGLILLWFLVVAKIMMHALTGSSRIMGPSRREIRRNRRV